MRDQKFVRVLSEEVRREGGRVFYVGGCVRDKIMGLPANKDLDIEVYGVTPEKLREIAGRFGQIRLQGASFGVLNVAGHHVDIAQPRTETAIGRGHKDFEVCVDPFIAPEKAAARRDFTMNAILEDVLTGEIVDPFGGVKDILENRQIRHVRDESFVEDPLRVFRGAQFAARFGFALPPETLRLCRSIPVDALPRERIAGELDKALLLAPRPSIFFSVLREMGQLATWFPELLLLIGAKQNPVSHPEGDVWTHTMMVLDEAAAIREKLAVPEHGRGFLLAALCHDLGKPQVTVYDAEKGKYTAYGHDKASGELAEGFMERIYGEKKLQKYVCNLASLHIQPRILLKQEARGEASDKDFMFLFDSCVCPEDLIELVFCDGVGRDRPPEWKEKERERRRVLLEKLALYRERMAQPEVRGEDLVRMGYRPGKEIGEMLARTHALHLAGLRKEEVLQEIADGTLCAQPKTEEEKG